MRRRADLLLLLAPVLLGGSSTLPAATPVPSGPLRVGVATHFDQGWSLSLMDRLGGLRLRAIRDDLPWGKVEHAPGEYDFSGPSAAYVARACAQGVKLLLMIDPRHQAYDGNASVYSPTAQVAYAAYLSAVLDHYGSNCVAAIEVGNEINAGDPRLPPGVSIARVHASLLKTVSQLVKPRYPEVRILGGSSNMVATGFEDELFAHGALAHLDGVAVHPYRDHPEGLDDELARLVAVMRRHGQVKPIWATEIGDEVDDPRAAASLLVRMLCLLGAEPDLAAIYWYALIDEPYFRNTGLMTPQARIKPAGEAMLAVNRHLLPKGRPVRLHGQDRSVYVYRFGRDSYVLWGVPRAVRIEGPGRIFDAQGRPLPALTSLSSDPVIVVGATQVVVGDGPVLADSLYQYGAPPWHYYGRRRSGEMLPLRSIDWTWSSYWGDPDLRPLAIGGTSATPAGDPGNPLAATVRYTAAASGPAAISACFAKAPRGDGVTVAILHNGRPLRAAVLRDRLAIAALPVRLAAGDRLDFAFGPHGTADGDALTYRIRLLKPGAGEGAAAPCA
ncbi:hypothetical protein [uncultured Sphingomonas sp.]|uniref:hypothetical protein n=1 Tax=uncultured Sphingomonas sp. TaxID=158754 RepID=UPI0025CF326A|nr:hypothetical protein [uncultured Sphingomonas sp.]